MIGVYGQCTFSMVFSGWRQPKPGILLDEVVTYEGEAGILLTQRLDESSTIRGTLDCIAGCLPNRTFSHPGLRDSSNNGEGEGQVRPLGPEESIRVFRYLGVRCSRFEGCCRESLFERLRVPALEHHPGAPFCLFYK